MMTVDLVPTPNEITDSSIKQYLANCVMVVRNKQPKDNDKLFGRLMKESYGNKPSRVFEYVPCVIGYGQASVIPFYACKQYFGFSLSYDGKYYTNARELINWGWKWEDILEVIDFHYYQAIQVKAPYFLYGQISTHTQITSVSHSNRYTPANLGYWMPTELWDYYLNRDHQFKLGYTTEFLQEQWNNYVENWSPKKLEAHMKALGVKRREVYARGSDMLAYRVYTLGGYTNNPYAWHHFIKQRAKDPHTQHEMRVLAGLIEGHIGIYDTGIQASQKN